MYALTLLAFLVAAAVSAFLLVVFHRQEETLRNFDLDAQEEFWLKNSSGARVAAIVTTALSHVAFAIVLTMLTFGLWHLLRPYLPPLPQEAAPFTRVLDAADAPHDYLFLLPAFIQTPLLHFVAIGWLVLAHLRTMWLNTAGWLYDIFISYKSEDAPFARRVADALLAAGWRVWFAEYQIVLNWRRWFKSMFMTGIRHSRFGLVITNDKWARSEHCAMEARLLLMAVGPEHVIELRAPAEPLPHQHFPKLARSPAIESRDVNSIVGFLNRETRNPFPAAAIAEAGGNNPFSGVHDGRRCSINVAGWSVFGPGDDTLTSAHWEYDALPDSALWGRLSIEPVDAGELERRMRFGMDERQMFEVMASWLRKGLKPVLPDPARIPANRPVAARRVREARDTGLWKHAKVRGIHLVFHDGRPQWGITHWPGVRDVWMRVVSLDVQNPVTKAAANFAFTFTFHGSFRDYCRHTHLMDALALSLKWA
jgi:hypothetical protein